MKKSKILEALTNSFMVKTWKNMVHTLLQMDYTFEENPVLIILMNFQKKADKWTCGIIIIAEKLVNNLSCLGKLLAELFHDNLFTPGKGSMWCTMSC